MGDFKSLFKDKIMPEPELGGDWGGSKNGADIPGGQKGTPGIMPEVTFVDAPGGANVGSSAGLMDTHTEGPSSSGPDKK